MQTHAWRERESDRDRHRETERERERERERDRREGKKHKARMCIQRWDAAPISAIRGDFPQLHMAGHWCCLERFRCPDWDRPNFPGCGDLAATWRLQVGSLKMVFRALGTVLSITRGIPERTGRLRRRRCFKESNPMPALFLTLYSTILSDTAFDSSRLWWSRGLASDDRRAKFAGFVSGFQYVFLSREWQAYKASEQGARFHIPHSPLLAGRKMSYLVVRWKQQLRSGTHQSPQPSRGCMPAELAVRVNRHTGTSQVHQRTYINLGDMTWQALCGPCITHVSTCLGLPRPWPGEYLLPLLCDRALNPLWRLQAEAVGLEGHWLCRWLCHSDVGTAALFLALTRHALSVGVPRPDLKVPPWACNTTSSSTASIYLSIYLSVCLPVNLSIYKSVSLSQSFASIYLTVYLSIYLSIYPSIDLYVPTSVHLYTHAGMHTYMHACFGICMHACMHTYLRTYIHASARTDIC